MIRDRWQAAVLKVMPNDAAICFVERPVEMSFKTSISRDVNFSAEAFD